MSSRRRSSCFPRQKHRSQPLLPHSLKNTPRKAVDYLFEHVAQPRHVRTARSILASKRAPAFNDEVMNQIPRLIATSLQSKERFIPGLSLCLDPALLDPDAFARCEDLIQALLHVWDAEFSQEADVGYHLPLVQTRVPSLLISMFRN